MMKLADYVADFLVAQKIKQVFTVSGAGSLHLLDSIARHEKIEYICTHHEQAATMAMEGYARVTGGLGVALVTFGPGVTNAVTGVVGAWMDSTPCLVLSGQSKRAHTRGERDLRQFGIQEVNVMGLAHSITKYSKVVDDPLQIRYELEKAVFLAKSGRPGPVWLDIPMDVQAVQIDPAALKGYTPSATTRNRPSPKEIARTIELLNAALRPVLLAGNGIRLAGAAGQFLSLVEALGIPVLTSWNAADLIASSHPLYTGRPGTYGQRGANFALQNSDFLISIGARLSLPQAGYEGEEFARAATKVIVDVDAAELEKFTFPIDLSVCADAGEYISALLDNKKSIKPVDRKFWVARCQKWKKDYPVCLPEYKNQTGAVNSYYFIDTLCDVLGERDIVVTDMGTAFTCTHQAFQVKPGQRLFTSCGLASMGYGLPGAIGACFANEKRRVVCLVGDGALQMNLQELQTVIHHKLPIKLFVIDNQGYLSIRVTQDNLFKGRHAGSDPESGITCPDTIAIAKAYGFPTIQIAGPGDLRAGIERALAAEGPVVCEVKMAKDQPLIPKLSFKINSDGSLVSPPLEDLYPFLERAEFEKNMIVAPPQKKGKKAA